MRKIPRLNAKLLLAGEPASLSELRRGAHDVGFFTIRDTPLSADRVKEVLEAYRAFFALPAAQKAAYDMAKTGSNRGWGAPGSEQVDPNANPDYKQVFDIGYAWPESGLSAYAPNLWPQEPSEFRDILKRYYADALDFSRNLLGAVIDATGGDRAHFDGAFDKPMALLRGNYYPARPDWAGEKDFGIATHTDYGCLTLLATDGVPGLEVRLRGGGWEAVTAEPGEFVVNFGEMLEMWTDRRIVATPHRVVGGTRERLSMPLFFNPRFDVNVAPAGAPPIRAVDHLQKRFSETYVHLKNAS